MGIEKIIKYEEDNEPLCLNKKNELVSHTYNNSGRYCIRHFNIGEHCGYLRIKDKTQCCNYYKGDIK